MAKQNQCNFIGNMVKTPEIKQLKNGLATSFRLGISPAYKGGPPEYLDFEAYGQNAENICTYVTKGRPIAVTCQARTKKWKDNEGYNKSMIVFKVIEIMFLGDKDKYDNKQISSESSAGNQKTTQADNPNHSIDTAYEYDSDPFADSDFPDMPDDYPL